MKKKIFLVVSLLLLVCFLTGCGSGSSTNGTSGTSTSSVWTDVQVVALKLKIEDFKNADKLYENYFGEYNLPIGFKDLIKPELQMVANGFALTESQGGNINQKMLFAHQTIKNFFATKMMNGEMNDFIKSIEEAVNFAEQGKSAKLYREIYKKELEEQELIATTTMSQEEKKEVEIREEQVKKTEEEGPSGFDKHVKEQEQLVVDHNLPYKLEKSANKVLHLEELVKMKNKGGGGEPAPAAPAPPKRKQHYNIEYWDWWNADIVLAHGLNNGGIFSGDIWGYYRYVGVYNDYAGRFMDSMPLEEVKYSNWERWKFDYYELGAFYMPSLTSSKGNLIALRAAQYVGTPWAYGHPKTFTSFMYCSQLVWIAYMWEGIDLDSDGGYAVLPDDISKSHHLLRKWKVSIAQ